jgi:hypothetical protein
LGSRGTVGIGGKHEAEGQAAACRALEVDEDEVIAAGQDPRLRMGDGLTARAAGEVVEAG